MDESQRYKELSKHGLSHDKIVEVLESERRKREDEIIEKTQSSSVEPKEPKYKKEFHRKEPKSKYSEKEEYEARYDGYKDAAELKKVNEYLERELGKKRRREFLKEESTGKDYLVTRGEVAIEDIKRKFKIKPKPIQEIVKSPGTEPSIIKKGGFILGSKESEKKYDIHGNRIWGKTPQELSVAEKMFGTRKIESQKYIEKEITPHETFGESLSSELKTTGAFAIGSFVDIFDRKPMTVEKIREKIRKEELKEKVQKLKEKYQEKGEEQKYQIELAKIKASQPFFGTSQKPKPKPKQNISEMKLRRLSQGAYGGRQFSLGGSLGGQFMNMNLGAPASIQRRQPQRVTIPTQRRPEKDPFGLATFSGASAQIVRTQTRQPQSTRQSTRQINRKYDVHIEKASEPFGLGLFSGGVRAPDASLGVGKKSNTPYASTRLIDMNFGGSRGLNLKIGNGNMGFGLGNVKNPVENMFGKGKKSGKNFWEV